MFRRIVGGLVDAAGRRPIIVLFLGLLFMIGSWSYARNLQLRSDFLELLPRDSPGFKAFEHQLGRVGGTATFLVVVESPDRKANERFVDDLSANLEAESEKLEACLRACAETDAACKNACGPDFIAYVESGTKDLAEFFEKHKWLYVSLSELEAADETLDHEIAYRSGAVERLEDAPSPPSPTPTDAADAARPGTLGMDAYYERWKNASAAVFARRSFVRTEL